MNLKDLAVVVGSMSAIGVLSHIRARSGGSLAEIEALESLAPEETFVGLRKELPASASELLAADGSRVRVGRGLSLRDGTLSTSDGMRPARFGQDVFLL